MPFVAINAHPSSSMRAPSKHRKESVPDAGRCDDESSVAATISDRAVPLSDDILVHILEFLPAKSLASMRAVSRGFSCTVSHLLRTRFRAITCSESYELLLESCAPSAMRQDHRQRIHFSCFTLDPRSTSVELAEFHFGPQAPIPQYITLDDDQNFGNNLLALYIRSVSSAAREVEPTTTTTTTTTRVRGYGGGIEPASMDRSRPPPTRQYAWTLAVANGMDRVFRSWFERADLAPYCSSSSPEDSSSSERSERPTTTRMLKPTSSCALHSAHISCYLVHGVARNPAITYEPVPGAVPKRFEFEYQNVKVDIARLVVSVEEGMRRSGEKERLLMWFRV